MIKRLTRPFSSTAAVYKELTQRSRATYEGKTRPLSSHNRTQDISRAKDTWRTSQNRFRRPRTAYTKQYAAHILSKLTGEKIPQHSIGPTSNEDTRFIPMVKDRPSLLYTILGITENQLKDSVIVDKTVKRFLDRDQIEKAIKTCHLAKDKGTVAMNRIHAWYISKGRITEAIDLYNRRKKYGILPNGATLTTIFDGCANSERLTPLQVEKIEKILLGYKDQLNYSHVHSAFQAMLNCDDKSTALELFNKWSETPCLKQIHPTSQLYTILIEGLIGTDDVAQHMNLEYIWGKVLQLPAKQRDPILYEAYVNAYLNMHRMDLVTRGFTAASSYFYIDTTQPKIMKEKSRFQVPKDALELMAIKPLERKYHPSQRLTDLLMKTYMQLGDYACALDIFEQFKSSGKVNDLGLWNRCIICHTNMDKVHAGSKAVEIYKSLKTLAPRVRPNGATRWLVLNAIYTESLSHLNDQGRYCIGAKAGELYDLSTQFLNDIDTVTAQELEGYLKSLTRLRLTRTQRRDVLKVIEKHKPNFDAELKRCADRKKQKEYINKVLKTEKLLRQKEEMKTALNGT